MVVKQKTCRIAVSHVLFLVLLVMLSSATVAVAIEGTTIVKKTGAFYAAQKSLSADVVVNLNLPPQFQGMGGIPPISYEFLRKEPNSFAMLSPSGSMEGIVVQDGKEYYSEMSMLGMGVLREFLPLDAICAEEYISYLYHPGSRFLMGLGLESGNQGALVDMSDVELVGDEEVEGIACYHLKINDSVFKGEIWVTKGDEPWIRRFIESAPEADPSDEPDMMMINPDLDIHISNWNSSPDFGDKFTIEPGHDIELRSTMPTMEEIAAKMGGGGGSGMGEPNPLVGQKAPGVTLNLLDGNKLPLSDLRGKVVVLDFWTTWCKPCIMALPLVNEITARLADEGVVFYAVNQMESKSQIETFLKKKGLDIPVALDVQAAVGESFGVSGLPHSVLIDKKGVVRKVHVGFGPGMEKMLEKEIEELLNED